MDNVELVIRTAIQQKRRVSATYKERYRELCPHALGWKGDRAHVLSYQCGGESKGGLSRDDQAQNWRCMDLDELEDVAIIDGEWVTFDNHSQPSNCFDSIDVEVTY